MKKNVLIIGAGPAGLSAAYQLSLSKDYRPIVVEKSSSVGGLSRTINIWGHFVDLGPHRFFCSNIKVNSLWKSLVGTEYAIVSRTTRIFYQGKFFDYPLKMKNVLKNLSFFESFRCFASYLIAKLFPPKDQQSFESCIVGKFGRRLFQLFFKSYTEKLWGQPCFEIDADFAMQRIKNLTFFEVLKDMIGPKSSQFKHKTLVDQFAYPNYGAVVPYVNMAKKIQDNGGLVLPNTTIHHFVLDEKKRIIKAELSDGEMIEFDEVISSMPITDLVNLLSPPSHVVEATQKLKFRNTIIVYLKIDSMNLFSDQWIYIHSENLDVGRITNFRNWSPELYGADTHSILAMEYWCSDHEALWNETEDQLVERAKRELVELKLCRKELIKDALAFRIPQSYPVYSRGYKNHLAPVIEFLKTFPNLQAIGRYGSFKYNNQDHSLLMGLLAAENLEAQIRINLWDVNEGGGYQEASKFENTTL